MLPQIIGDDSGLGFHWARPDGTGARLVDLLDIPGAEPHRWLPTHLEALDEVLIEIAGRFGNVLGGGRRPSPDEHADLATAYRSIDRATHEYADAHAAAQVPDDPRAGQIIGTGALMSMRIRDSLGVMGPAPFDGQLDTPGPGLVGGTCALTWVEPELPQRGARWLVSSTDGRRLPATLSMLLFDSSGVMKDPALDEHREALSRVTDAVTTTTGDPYESSGAVDWLLFDWVMAHRESPDSGAVEIKSGKVSDARMIVRAAAASAKLRSGFDPDLLRL